MKIVGGRKAEIKRGRTVERLLGQSRSRVLEEEVAG